MLAIRPYRPEDFPGIERVHDRARRVELRYAGLEDAFLPLRIAAEREDLFAYPGLFVAELGGEIAGFAACTQEELAWLYVDPAHARKGVGRALPGHPARRGPGRQCAGQSALRAPGLCHRRHGARQDARQRGLFRAGRLHGAPLTGLSFHSRAPVLY